MNEYTLNVVFHIRAPIMVKASSTWEYGIDVMFHRDFKNKITIPASHIKGKLREAMNDLHNCGADIDSDEINRYLGKGSGDESQGNYDPSRGMIRFTDLKGPETSDTTRSFCRTSIDDSRGTVEKGHLFVIETPFVTGEVVEFKGTISFISDDDSEGQKILKDIKTSLKWITTLGAYKGVGYGNIRSIKIDAENKTVPVFNGQQTNTFSKPQVLKVTIEPEEPMILGGKRHKTIYQKSINYIPGSVIKGSLATNINKHLNSGSFNTPISRAGGIIESSLPGIKRYYDDIRFTHAFPTTASERPHRIPLSLFYCSDVYRDMFMSTDEYVNNISYLAFQADWKDSSKIMKCFGWAEPKRIFHTRTMINPKRRAAEHENLFTYEYICPRNMDDELVKWIGKVFLPNGNLSEEDMTKLANEIKFSLESYLKSIGKRSSRIKVTCGITGNDDAPPPVSQGDEIALTLQSEALMLDPGKILKTQSLGSSLFEEYKSYWNDVFGSSLEMTDFYAEQDLHGGYIFNRYQYNRLAPKDRDPYYPFYVTKEGSTFLMKVNDPDISNDILERIYLEGLKIPDWAENRYTLKNRKLWQTCPFLPANGYGEVLITKVDYYEKLIKERM